VLFFHLGENESIRSIQLMQSLREKGIRCELYHENSKFDKQFKYAEKKGIPYVIILGSQELAEGKVVVKDLTKGQQVTILQETLTDYPF
jgi:histidyl-tRNA synthetase